jgi:predicted nucleic-acid-binding protein
VINLDTNVLLRLVLKDDARRAARAESLLTRCVEKNEACLVTEVVLCELAWVLQRTYRASRAELLAVLDHLASGSPFAFQDPDLLRQAVASFRQGRQELADLLIGLRGEATGAATTYTFDRGLRRTAEFTLLEA